MKKQISLILLFFSVILTFSEARQIGEPMGATWQQTIRITGLIEPSDFFGRFNVSENNNAEISNEFRKNAENFWHPLRDSINNALTDGRISAYTIRPIGRVGQERIFVQGESISYPQLISNLNTSLERVAGLRGGDVIYLTNRNDVVDIRNFVSDFSNYYQNLDTISQFEIEFQMTYNERGFNLKPIQLILGSAMYPSRFQFEDNRLSFFNDYENGLGFLIDLTDPSTTHFLNNSGVRVSGETSIISFMDLFLSLNYEYVFFSISGRELAQAADAPFNYELEILRQGVMNDVHRLLLEQVYGQVPHFWLEKGGGLIFNEID